MSRADQFLARNEAAASQKFEEGVDRADEFLSRQKGEAFSEVSALGDVYDGDTVYDDQGGQRILGGNTSEMKSADGSSQPLSIEAQERMKELLNSGQYTKKVSGEKGYYGRDLTSYVNAEGESAMTQLIREGYAAPTSYGGNDASISAEGAAINAQFEASNTFAKTGSTPALDAMRNYGTEAGSLSTNRTDRRSFGKRALARGTDLMQMNYYQFGELMGEFSGVDVMKEWGEEGVIRNMYEAALSPAEIESTDDIESLYDLGTYIIERGIENAPNFLADIGVAAGAIAATVATGGLAATAIAPAIVQGIAKKFVSKVGWKAAGKFGLGASMYGQMAGESRGTQLAAGVDNPLLALGTGAVNTSLEYIGFQSIVKGFMPKGRITNAAALAKHIVAQAGIGTVGEGLTEFTQGLTNQLAIKMAKPDHEIDWDDLKESFFAGAAAGGGTSTVLATAGGGTNYLLEKSRMKNVDTNTVPETPQAVQAQVNEVSSPESTRDTTILPQKESLKDIEVAEGLIVAEHPEGSAIVTSSPEKAAIFAEKGMAAAKELRGYQQSKQEILESGEATSIVTRTDAEGNELSSEAVAESKIPEALARERAEAKPTDTVQVTKAEQSKVLEERQAALEAVDNQNLTQSQVAAAGEKPSTLEMPTVPEEAAPKEVNRLDNTPVPEAEQGTAQLNNEKGELRPAAELIHDLNTGKLSYDTVIARLKELGVNVEANIESTDVAMDREATIATLLSAGIKADVLMHPKGDKRAKFNPYRNARDIFLDQSITDQDLQELAKTNNVAPTIQDDFNEVKMVDKVIERLERQSSMLPDDVSGVAFLFKNPKAQLVRDTSHADRDKHQPRIAFTAGLRVVGLPRKVLLAHLDTFNVDGIATDARKLELARIGAVLGVKVSGKERTPGPLTRPKKNIAVTRIQQLYDASTGPTQQKAQTTKQKAEIVKANAAKKLAAAEVKVVREYKRKKAAKAAKVITDKQDAKTARKDKNKKAVVTEDLAAQIEAGMKNLDVGDIPSEEAATTTVDDKFVDSDTRTILEEARAKAFDLALVAAVFKEAGLPLPAYIKLRNWKPEAKELDTPAVRARVVRLSRSQSAKDHVRRLLGVRKDRAALITRIQEAPTDAKRIEILQAQDKIGLIDRPRHEYNSAMLDGEREAKLWDVVDEDPKGIIDGADRKLFVDPGVSVPEDSPEVASAKSFYNRLGSLEVHDNTDEAPQAIREFVNDKPREGKILSERFVFGGVFVKRGKPYYNDKHSGPAIANTEKTDGANLILTIKDSSSFRGPVFLDAIRLTQMGLGRKAGTDTKPIHTMGDALRGFYTGVDRMGVQPEVDIGDPSNTYAIDMNTLSDNLVIHITEDGAPVTLGEAKAADHKLNPGNPSWMRKNIREEVQDEVDLLNKDLGRIYRRLLAKLKAAPNNAELKHAVSWMEGQMDRYEDRNEEGAGRGAASPVGDYAAFVPNRKESKNKRLERADAERKAIRKLAPTAPQITDSIVAVWNRARTTQFDDTMGFGEEVQNSDSSNNIDNPLNNERLDSFEAALRTEAEDKTFDEKQADQDPDGLQIAAYLGDDTVAAEAATAGKLEGTDSGSTPSMGRPRREADKVEQKYAPTKKATILGKGLAKKRAVITKLLNFTHSKLGMRLPLVVISSSDLKSNTDLDAATIEQLRKNMDAGHNGAFLSMKTYGIIVLNDSGQSDAATLAIMSHELGHAIFESMYAENQAILEGAHKKSGSKADLREWVADQIAHHIAANGATALKGSTNKFTATIAKIADALIGLWRQATTQLMASDMYMDFNLFFQDAISRVDDKTSDVGGGFRATIPNTNLYNLSEKEAAQKLRATGAKAKQAAKDSWRPITKVVRSVYSRIADYSKPLMAELYQKSQTKGTQAYEQLQRFLHDEMQGKFAKLELRIGEKAMKQAFADLRSGNLTANARAVRKTINDVNKLLKDHVPTMHFRDDFVPEAFDHAAIEKNRVEFEQLLVDADVASSADVHTVVQDLLYADGISDYSLAPGKAVSTHQTVNAILSAVGSQKLIDAGFLLDNPHAIMSHYISTSAKRAAWEFKFGGYTDKYQGDPQLIRYRLLSQAGYDVAGMSGKQAETLTLETGLEKGGKFYSPNHRINQYMEQIKEEFGESGVKEVKELLDSALGRLGNNIPSSLRTSFDWVTTWMNLTLLAFSGVASIPELAGSVIRARGQLSIADFVDVVKDMKQARRFATDLGIILTDGAEQMALETMGAQYSSPMQHKISQVFFKVNGQQFITRLSRTLAVSTGTRFMLNAAQRVKEGDTAAVTELEMIHIDAKTVNQWVADGMPTDNMVVNKALNQFVYESSIKPSKFEATKWGNNPYWKLAWHLKQFFYSYGTVIVGGIARHTYQKYQEGVANGNVPVAAALMASTPLLIAGLAFLPLAGLSEELRELIKGTNRTDKMRSGEYMSHLLSKTGGLGPFEMLSSMNQAYDWNKSVVASMTPTTGLVETMLSSEVSGEKKLKRMIPFYSQGVLGGLFD